MIWMGNTTGHARIGLIVPKHQSTAVARNRLRRRLREIWRREVRASVPGWDVVVRPRREAYGATFEQLRGEMVGWARTVSGARER